MMAKRPGDRSGVCICGAAVADHFTKSGRKRSCEDVLRVTMINGQAAGPTGLAGTMSGFWDATGVTISKSASFTLKLVKSDRRRIAP